MQPSQIAIPVTEAVVISDDELRPYLIRGAIFAAVGIVALITMIITLGALGIIRLRS